MDNVMKKPASQKIQNAGNIEDPMAEPKPFFKKWWFWAIVLVIVAIGAYYFFM